MFPEVLKYKEGSGQVQFTFPSKQTGRLQVTDQRFARLGKVVNSQFKDKVRTAQRRKAAELGEDPKLLNSAVETVDMIKHMHDMCQEDVAKFHSITGCLRESGYMSHMPNPRRGEEGQPILVAPAGSQWATKELASGESFTPEMRRARFENWEEGRRRSRDGIA